MDVKVYTGKHENFLYPPNGFDLTDPKYIAVDNSHVVAVLPVGTRFRIARLMQDNGEWGGVQVTATLDDGDQSKIVYVSRTLLAGNRFLYDPLTAPSTNWGVNPDFLEEVK